MRVTPRSRLLVRAQNVLFVVLFLTAIGLLGWASTRYGFELDWTAGGRNSLSEPSRRLLERLEQPVRVTAYATESEVLRTRIRDLVARYQRRKPNFELEFVNPDTAPEQVRRLRITVNGELLVEYAGRTEHVREHSEQALTNALQRLARTEERWVAYLSGHGERDLLGDANYDLGNWGRQLQERGLQVQALNLAEAGEVPGNTAVLVIASPQVDLLPSEVTLIERYLAQGGNLLWLSDPGPARGLEALARRLGVEFPQGVIVDPTLQRFGVNDPTFVPVSRYPRHPITRDFDLLTVYPEAGAIAPRSGEGSSGGGSGEGAEGESEGWPKGWKVERILETGARAWLERGPLEGEITLDAGADRPGPLTLGLAYERERNADREASASTRSEGAGTKGAGENPGEGDPRGDAGAPGGTQRLVVIADGDFLSNTYLGNQGNLDLGMNIINWLSSDEQLIAIPAKSAPDRSLTLSSTTYAVIAFAVLGLPVLLLGTGVGIWWRRRRR